MLAHNADLLKELVLFVGRTVTVRATAKIYSAGTAMMEILVALTATVLTTMVSPHALVMVYLLHVLPKSVKVCSVEVTMTAKVTVTS